jgi:hypothetical protein
MSRSLSRATSLSSLTDVDSQVSLNSGHPSLSIDTSILDSMSISSSSPPFSSTPPPFTPGGYSPEQPPPFSMHSPLAAAPAYSLGTYVNMPALEASQFDLQGYNFIPAPPYAEPANTSIPQQRLNLPLVKEEQAYYTSKAADNGMHQNTIPAYMATPDMYYSL